MDAEGSGEVKVGADSFQLKRKSKSVKPGKTVTLKLKPKGKKAKRKIVKAIKNGDKPKAKVDVKLTDKLGNELSDTVNVKLK